MLRPPSNQRPYDEFYSRDPAFVQLPDSEPLSKLEPEARAARTRVVEDHERAIRIARETGDWKPLLAGEAEPTRFVMMPMSGDLFRKLGDLTLSDKLGGLELDQLVVRIALVDVVNLGDTKVDRRRPHENPAFRELGKVASVDITNLLDSIDRRIIGELGGLVMTRARGPDPK